MDNNGQQSSVLHASVMPFLQPYQVLLLRKKKIVEEEEK